MIQFRTRSNKLPVEVGAWENIDYNDRICTLCDRNCIGDEFHYLLECDYFRLSRIRFIDRNVFRYPNTICFKQLLQLNDDTNVKYRKLCKLIKEIILKFR